jgi:hypothetical protein
MKGSKNIKQKEGEKLPNGLTEAEHARILAEHEYNVPDRIAGYEAVDELRRCCEGREFRFVTVDVTYAVCCRFLASDGDSTDGDDVQKDGVEQLASVEHSVIAANTGGEGRGRLMPLWGRARRWPCC